MRNLVLTSIQYNYEIANSFTQGLLCRDIQ